MGNRSDSMARLPPSRGSQVAISFFCHCAAARLSRSIGYRSNTRGRGRPHWRKMRRLITHFNALLLGMILGMVFVAIVHAPPSHRQEEVRASRITIGYEILGTGNQTTVVLIAGTTTQLVHLPAVFCAYLVNQGCQASPSAITRSASLVRPARQQQAALRKEGARLPFDR
jgi:hypothetical protein